MIIDIDKLRPECSSESGFLNENESLNDVIQADRNAIKTLDLQYDQFADRLLSLIEKTQRKLHLWIQQNKIADMWEMIGQGILVEQNYKVSFVSYMGYQNCPFGCKSREAKSDADYTITNIKTGESVFFSELHVHLIREHHFFEGHTKYRLDPEKCARVLEICSGQNYSPQYTSKEYWVGGSKSWSSTCKTIDDYIEYEYREESKQVMQGKVISLHGNKMGWEKDDCLYIISLDPAIHESIVVGGIPIRCLDEGASIYKRQTIKWVDD